MIKVVLDTDIGDDIDDAFALSLACKDNNVDLVAVTTVFKNTLCRTRQAKQLLQALGKDVPVYTGERIPYHGEFIAFQKDSGDLSEVPSCQYDNTMDEFSSDGDAVKALIDLSYQYKGELVVVPIGPLTNVAKAIERDENFAKNVKKIVTMGGWFTNPVGEWNIICDPQAAHVVYSSGIPLYAVGLDVTLQCPLDANLLDDVRQSDKPHAQLIAKWLKRWFDYFNFDKSVLHDPLAVACLSNTPCTFKQKYCKVSVEKDRFGVIDVCDYPQDDFYPIFVATDVDRDEFYKVFRNLFFN